MNEKTELQKHEVAEGNRKRPRKDKKKGKGEGGRRWMFLAVDLFLVAIIVGAVVLITVTLSPSADDGEDAVATTVIYQLEISGVEADLFGVTGGESVIHAADGSVIGVVEYHDGGQIYTEYIGTASERDGKYFADKVTYPEDMKAYVVTVRADAAFRAGVGYFANGCRLAVGRSYQLRIADYTYTGECIALQPVTGN